MAKTSSCATTTTSTSIPLLHPHPPLFMSSASSRMTPPPPLTTTEEEEREEEEQMITTSERKEEQLLLLLPETCRSSCSWPSGGETSPHPQICDQQQQQHLSLKSKANSKVRGKLKDIFNKYLNRCYVNALDHKHRCQCGGSCGITDAIYSNSSVYSFYQPPPSSSSPGRLSSVPTIHEDENEIDDSPERDCSTARKSERWPNKAFLTLPAEGWPLTFKQQVKVGSGVESGGGTDMVRALSEGPRSHFLHHQNHHYPIPAFPRSLSLEPGIASNSPPPTPKRDVNFNHFPSHYDSMPMYEGIGHGHCTHDMQETIDRTEDAISSMEKAIKCIDNVLEPPPRGDSQGRIQYDVISVLPKPPSIPLPPPRRSQPPPSRSHSFRDRARSVMNSNSRVCVNQQQWSSQFVVVDGEPPTIENGMVHHSSAVAPGLMPPSALGFLNGRARSAPPIQPGFGLRRGW